jgi:hypothetical protein
MFAVWANEVAHVFDNADQIHFHLAKHFDGFASRLATPRQDGVETTTAPVSGTV